MKCTHTHTNPLFMPVALWSMPFQFSQAKHDFYSSKNQEKKKRVQLTLKKTLFTILIRGLFYFDMQTVGPVHSYII